MRKIIPAGAAIGQWARSQTDRQRILPAGPLTKGQVRILHLLLLLVWGVLSWCTGHLLVWPGVHVYDHNVTAIPRLPPSGLQSFRGALWSVMALYVVSRLKTALARCTALTAPVCGGLTMILPNYPNPLVTGIVRMRMAGPRRPVPGRMWRLRIGQA